MPRVSVTIQDHIAHVTLTRGDKMNAFDMEMAKAIVAAGEQIKATEKLRSVVLSGEGKSFYAGLDVMNFAKFAATDPEALVMPRTHGQSNLFQQVAMVWRQIDVPVIAALHGAVYGAGLQLAIGADIRIAHPDSRLAIMEMKWGLIPDMGGMVLLPQLLRSDVLRQMIYTADPITAQKAEAWGLVTELSDTPMDAALTLAETIASKSPSAIRAAKRLIDVAESGASTADILLAESREQTALIGKPHQLEVIAANMQKRAPKFD